MKMSYRDLCSVVHLLLGREVSDVENINDLTPEEYCKLRDVLTVVQPLVVPSFLEIWNYATAVRDQVRKVLDAKRMVYLEKKDHEHTFKGCLCLHPKNDRVVDAQARESREYALLLKLTQSTQIADLSQVLPLEWYIIEYLRQHPDLNDARAKLLKIVYSLSLCSPRPLGTKTNPQWIFNFLDCLTYLIKYIEMFGRADGTTV